jgi:peptidoglycan/LPS O-acetylase OafA/YrhL
LANGALAMTRLFLLSGAVLTLGYRHLRLEAADLAAFYRSRVARIMPVF